MRVFKLVETIDYNIDCSPRGAFTIMVKINEKWGIKLFFDKHERDYIYENQKTFAQYGYGPEVGGKIDFRDVYRQYGYITEIVETVIPGHLVGSERSQYAEEFYEKYGGYDDQEDNEIKEIIQEMEETTGIAMTDMHAGNWGWKNGQLIPIDFGFDYRKAINEQREEKRD